jgi:DNA-3-methyladenine glycosylase
MSNDKLFLQRAIKLASENISAGGGPFGAIIVKENEIISEAGNKVVLNNDPTAHAEILAIRQASSLLQSYDLSGCTLYSSCEPCPMCLGAIYWAGIKKVVYSCDRTDAEAAGFSDSAQSLSSDSVMTGEKKYSENGMNSKTKFLIETMTTGARLTRDFYTRDVLEVAPEILGKIMAVRLPDGSFSRHIITEVEAYRGTEDKACHASKGRTDRTEIMYHEGGRLYVYFIYGMYWMLNIVTEREGIPQAVLIRGVENYPGPGKLTRSLGINKSFYGEDLVSSERIWIEDTGLKLQVKSSERIGVDYAGGYWKSRPWRYYL